MKKLFLVLLATGWLSGVAHGNPSDGMMEFDSGQSLDAEDVLKAASQIEISGVLPMPSESIEAPGKAGAESAGLKRNGWVLATRTGLTGTEVWQEPETGLLWGDINDIDADNVGTTVNLPAARAYEKLSFPAEDRSKFFPFFIGVDHSGPGHRFAHMCTDYKGDHGFPHCYTGHTGSDFLLIGGFGAMEKGVEVWAAAPGKVVGIEQGKGDHCYWSLLKWGIVCDDNPKIQPNYVFVLQDDGLTAMYYHLRRASVVVSIGQRVKTGQKLAQVGSSGISATPHLHFELRDAQKNVIDPFEAIAPPSLR